MTDHAATVTVNPLADGVELQAVTLDGQRVVLRLDGGAALTLSDLLAMACERRLKAVA